MLHLPEEGDDVLAVARQVNSPGIQTHLSAEEKEGDLVVVLSEEEEIYLNRWD
jgi:hypothetical protein